MPLCKPARPFAVCLLALALHAATAQDPAGLTGEAVRAPAPADTLSINHGAAALEQLLLKLGTRASLMMIVAHPDDEDGGMLTLESRGAGARVAMLTLTRGEGGQNRMSADFNEALGLIRTQELLAADRYMGVDQMFGTEIDFGFSKTREETLAQWTHDRVLYDAVRAIRLYRPLIVASVFLGGVTDGHGHHQVAGEIAQEAFVAAADPAVFPEMGLAPWAPLKVYAREPFTRVTARGMYDYATGRWAPPRFHNYVTGAMIEHEPLANVTLHEGDAATVFGKPALGMEGLSYVGFARQGLALQRSQIGPGPQPDTAYQADTGYTLMATRVGCALRFCAVPESTREAGFFDGVDVTLPGIASLAPSMGDGLKAGLQADLASMAAQVAEAQRTFDPQHPELCAPALAQTLRVLDGLLAGPLKTARLPAAEKLGLLHELRVKRTQLNDALLLALGVELDGSLAVRASLMADQPYTVIGTLHLPPGTVLRGYTLELEGRTLAAKTAEPARQAWNGMLPRDAAPTRPYFYRAEAGQAFYTLTTPALRNAPSTPAPLLLHLALEKDGLPLEMLRAVTVTGPGGVAQSAMVTPQVGVAVTPRTVVLGSGMSSFSFTTTVEPRQAPVEIAVHTPAGWKVVPGSARETLHEEVAVAGKIDGPQSISTQAVAHDGHRYDEGFRTVGYPGLAGSNLYLPASLRVVPVDVRTAPALRIGYLPGTGDSVPDFLPSLGIHPTLLTVGDLTLARLAGFDAVLLGVRAYAAHPELAGVGSKALLDYAAAGGTVVVQYNTAGYGTHETPLPLDVPGDPAHNVVVEAGAVAILEPAAQALTWPNRITASDFTRWVDERGHGFPATFDPRWHALLEMHDPEQDPQRGGLLIADVGRGHYVYCALALYRELPEGVPGAYRLLANLLSLSRTSAHPTAQTEGPTP